LNSKKPKPPQMFYMKELDKTSWKLVILGAWKHALDNRKKGMVDMSMTLHEKVKLKEKSQYRAISWLSKAGKCMGYFALAITIVSIVTPMIAMNYISNQIKSGEWGADFIP
jgi:hypothetical protein